MSELDYLWRALHAVEDAHGVGGAAEASLVLGRLIEAVGVEIERRAPPVAAPLDLDAALLEAARARVRSLVPARRERPSHAVLPDAG